MQYRFNGRFPKGKYQPGQVYELTAHQAVNWKGLFEPVSGEAAPAGSTPAPAAPKAPEASTPGPTPSEAPTGAEKPLTAAEIVLRAQAARQSQ